MSKKLSSIQLPEHNDQAQEDQVIEKRVLMEDSYSEESSSSDSDIDMFEAFEKSHELQTILRQYIRNELQTLGPKIYAKIQAEHHNLLQAPVDNCKKEVQQEESKDVRQEEQEEEKGACDQILADTEVKSPQIFDQV